MTYREPKQITVAEMSPHIHHFEMNENKADKISEWLINWIKSALESGKIQPYDKLPSKGDLACHIGVSLGTMQNVFRYVEDCGLVESKQRIGTYIKDPGQAGKDGKLTSKREITVEIIKQYILDSGYQVNDYLVSARQLSGMTNISNATIRNAIGVLITEGILEKVENVFIVKRLDFSVKNITTMTLVEKIASNIKNYVENNLEKGSRIPSNVELAGIFNVSAKTIHDAVKLLSKDGVLNSRRGRYGTAVSGKEDSKELYCYEQAELKIRNYIIKNCEIGSKLPSIAEFSKEFEVSSKTIKKALDNLAYDGYLRFARGRHGGTFVTDMPQKVNEAYKWLALSADYVSNT